MSLIGPGPSVGPGPAKRTGAVGGWPSGEGLGRLRAPVERFPLWGDAQGARGGWLLPGLVDGGPREAAAAE
eukprot:5383178-Lingulodinium_polyedra.AAC.1